MQRHRISQGMLPLTVICLLHSPFHGQQLPWQGGPGVAEIGDGLAQIELAEGYIFLDRTGTKQLMELTENPLSGAEQATVSSASGDSYWFLVFEWDPIGYVDDTEGHSLDADAILSSIRQGTAAANKERERRGWTPINIVGWREAPHYDPSTNNLTWAILAENEGQKSINRIVKLLGRRGVMTATLVSGIEELDSASKQVDDLLAGYSFTSGNTYAEFVPGSDRMAEIGLTALIAGGAGAVLVKTGILARFWKLIVVGAAGLVGAIGRFFSKLTGRQPRPEHVPPAA
jgi:uncharacterized membrane-anchored protein